ncbi:MAG: hypothetical protein CMJ62_19745 [Planctomycetaceae bacterium]|nr:hypothetical protein [Planctomycetaceae bacterium]
MPCTDTRTTQISRPAFTKSSSLPVRNQIFRTGRTFFYVTGADWSEIPRAGYVRLEPRNNLVKTRT